MSGLYDLVVKYIRDKEYKLVKKFMEITMKMNSLSEGKQNIKAIKEEYKLELQKKRDMLEEF